MLIYFFAKDTDALRWRRKVHAANTIAEELAERFLFVILTNLRLGLSSGSIHFFAIKNDEIKIEIEIENHHESPLRLTCIMQSHPGMRPLPTARPRICRLAGRRRKVLDRSVAR